MLAIEILIAFEERRSMENEKLTREKYLALKEYAFGDKLRESYFRSSWTATSIILPICFGLVGLSYAQWLVNASWLMMLPLACASLFLSVSWFWYVSRYAGYLKIIYGRLQVLESTLTFDLHKKIAKEDKKGFSSLKYLKWVMLVLLIVAWVLRLCVAYSMSSFDC